MNDNTLLAFLGVLEKLKCNTRHSVTSTGRPESVAEHAFRTCALAWLLQEDFPALDMNRVLEMCLFHDIGEAVTGDIASFYKTDAHRAAEAEAVEGLIGMLEEPQRTRLAGLFAEMDAQQTEEARLYKALDRLEAVVQNNEAPLSSWLPLEYTLNGTYGEKEAARFPRLAALRARLKADTEAKILKEAEK